MGELSDAEIRRRRVTEEKHPPGYEPGLDYGADGGTGTVTITNHNLHTSKLPNKN